MRIVAISDTHGIHEKLVLPEADMILHAGDISNRGLLTEITAFLHWFASLPYQHKVFVAGNHDFFMDENPKAMVEALIPEGVTYLKDSGVEIEGIKIWGSPIQPWHHDWAFQKQRGEEIAKVWDLIPKETDILITHGPPHGILDLVHDGRVVGCEELLKRVMEIKPQKHIFGHIHEAVGELQQGGVHFINASQVDRKYNLVNPPVVFEL